MPEANYIEVLMVNEFKDVFLAKFPRLPLKREIEFYIDFVPWLPLEREREFYIDLVLNL